MSYYLIGEVIAADPIGLGLSIKTLARKVILCSDFICVGKTRIVLDRI